MSPLGRHLVLVRHGESTANAAGEFTGRRDVPLTERGREQASSAGRRLLDHGFDPDAVFCSSQSRTGVSASLILAVLGKVDIRPEPSASLDERDYGVLTGLDKRAAETRWGADQIKTWRRSYIDGPPEGESLRDTLARVAPFYIRRILPAAMRGCVLVVAHGNSLRALVMAIEGLTPTQVADLELPTGSIRLYALARDTTIAARTLIP